MDKIEKFEFELDISNCKLIYDYAAQEELRRPKNGVWDESRFRGRGTLVDIPVNEENEKMRVALMDGAIMDTRFLEKKIKVKTADDQECAKLISSDMKSSSSRDDVQYGGMDDNAGHLPRRLLPVYQRGELVKGCLVLSLREPMDAEALKMKFVGEVKVNVRIYTRNGYSDDTRYEKFVDASSTLWTKDEKQDISEAFQSMSVSDDPPFSSKLLPAGTHKFHFEYLIPEDAPQSIPPLVISSVNCAHLTWRLKAKIEKGGAMFRFGNIATHRGILVEYPENIAHFPDYLAPVVVEESLGTRMVQFWKSGSRVKVCASIPRKAFVKGENIPLELEVDNQSGGEIFRVEARIRLHGKARLSDSRMSLSNAINIKSEKVYEGPIASGMCPVFSWDLAWDFADSSSDGRLLPVGKLEESKLIEMKYSVVIKVKRKGFHRNMEMEMPIHIGNCSDGTHHACADADQRSNGSDMSHGSCEGETLAFPVMSHGSCEGETLAFPVMSHGSSEGETLAFPVMSHGSCEGETLAFPVMSHGSCEGETLAFPVMSHGSCEGETLAFPVMSHGSGEGETLAFPVMSHGSGEGETLAFPVMSHGSCEGETLAFPVMSHGSCEGETLAFPVMSHLSDDNITHPAFSCTKASDQQFNPFDTLIKSDVDDHSTNPFDTSPRSGIRKGNSADLFDTSPRSGIRKGNSADLFDTSPRSGTRKGNSADLFDTSPMTAVLDEPNSEPSDGISRTGTTHTPNLFDTSHSSVGGFQRSNPFDTPHSGSGDDGIVNPFHIHLADRSDDIRYNPLGKPPTSGLESRNPFDTPHKSRVVEGQTDNLFDMPHKSVVEAQSDNPFDTPHKSFIEGQSDIHFDTPHKSFIQGQSDNPFDTPHKSAVEGHDETPFREQQTTDDDKLFDL